MNSNSYMNFHSTFDHQGLDSSFVNLNLGKSVESGIYGSATAEGMNIHISNTNSDANSSRFKHEHHSQMSSESTHRNSISSYWDQPLSEHPNLGIDSSRDLQMSCQSHNSSNNTVIMDSSIHTKSSGFNTTFESDNDINNQNYKLELQLKETQIESLELEIKKLKSIFNQGLTFKQQEEQKTCKLKAPDYDSEVSIPANLEVIFSKLSDSLQKKDRELQETKKRLEGVITALALNPSNSTTKFGRYDEEALAHKIVVRLETLMKENQEMARMLSYGRVKETAIELELLRKENEDLKNQIKLMQSKSPSTISSD